MCRQSLDRAVHSVLAAAPVSVGMARGVDINDTRLPVPTDYQ
jgi:hypothetical protein